MLIKALLTHTPAQQEACRKLQFSMKKLELCAERRGEERRHRHRWRCRRIVVFAGRFLNTVKCCIREKKKKSSERAAKFTYLIQSCCLLLLLLLIVVITVMNNYEADSTTFFSVSDADCLRFLLKSKPPGTN